MAGRRSPGRDHSFRARRVKLLVSLLLAAAIFSFLFTRVDVASVWTEIRAMTWFELATIAAVAGWNLVTYWALWVAVTPGLTWPQAMVVAQSGTAVTNTVPGGSGIGVGLTYAMLESWGFSRGRSTLAVLITGVWNNLIKLGLPVLALALLALQGDAGGSRVVGRGGRHRPAGRRHRPVRDGPAEGPGRLPGR
jgi:putative heme transporter